VADYSWPDAAHRTLLGTRVSRVDGPVKVQGKAKYTFDYNPAGLLHGKIVRCPHAHARVKSVDTSAAEHAPGVKAVKVMQGPGKEIHWFGDEIVGIAATSEQAARDAAKLVKVEYEVLPHVVIDETEPPKELKNDDSPLSQGDIEDMLDNQVPEDEMVKQLMSRGITGRPSEELFKELPGYGVPPAVIKALREAPVREAAKGPRSPYKRTAAQTQGDPQKAFSDPNVVSSEGVYGVPVITHCCLESHGGASEWTDDKNLLVHMSTQNVSGIAGQMAGPLQMPASNIRVVQQHIGGGFGSKFGPDRWGILTAELSKLAGGKPVKIMLERDEELEVAGARPSAYARVKVAATKDGKLLAWDSFSWGTGGPGGGGSPPLPYVFNVPNQRKQHTAVLANIGPARAWRAPNHPQACVLTLCPLDDMAAKLNMDPVEFLGKNLDITGPRAALYADELKIASDLFGWKQKWHARGDKTAGHIKRGIGVSLHTWGGRGHESNCDITIHPDGAVDIKIGSQDLGTGTRTCIMMVAAETLGIPHTQINLELGDTKYPMSGGSGGSTTIGGVSSSTRRGAVDVRDQFLEKVAPSLKAQPAELEIVKGVVRVKSDHSRSLDWKQACAKIGAMPITARGKNPDRTKTPDLTNSGVGGVQMAEVSVDVETGIVKVEKMVAVQDMGYVINEKTAESQILGALIMGIGYALYEEKIMDPTTGRMLNPNMEFYRFAGLNDIRDLVVKVYSTDEQDKRGVIGLGEPPVVSPGAVISNAVANAIGVRVPNLPLTPDRVLEALEKGGAA
jgi:xanthine dehydrogenase YagR molybdenum-binding subunit